MPQDHSKAPRDPNPQLSQPPAPGEVGNDQDEPEPAEQVEILVAQITRLLPQLTSRQLYQVAADVIDMAYSRELAEGTPASGAPVLVRPTFTVIV